jgi:hypothetical protein
MNSELVGRNSFDLFTKRDWRRELSTRVVPLDDFKGRDFPVPEEPGKYRSVLVFNLPIRIRCMLVFNLDY